MQIPLSCGSPAVRRAACSGKFNSCNFLPKALMVHNQLPGLVLDHYSFSRLRNNNLYTHFLDSLFKKNHFLCISSRYIKFCIPVNITLPNFKTVQIIIRPHLLNITSLIREKSLQHFLPEQGEKSKSKHHDCNKYCNSTAAAVRIFKIIFRFFCVWLIPLSIMSSRSSVPCVCISFLFKAEYYFMICISHILFIHPLMDIWVVSPFAYCE